MQLEQGMLGFIRLFLRSFSGFFIATGFCYSIFCSHIFLLGFLLLFATVDLVRRSSPSSCSPLVRSKLFFPSFISSSANVSVSLTSSTVRLRLPLVVVVRTAGPPGDG